MDDLTDAQRSRLWAVFSQLDHKRRTHQIGRNECIREAYAACVRELPHEASLALVVRWGRRLGWRPPYRQIPRPYLGPRGGVVLGAEYEPIPEADQRAWIAIRVADLVPKEVPSVGLPFVALLDSILRERKPRISQEQWAEEQGIGHTTLKDWKAAGGKPIRGKVSEDMACEIETAILQDAEKLGLRLGPSSA